MMKTKKYLLSIVEPESHKAYSAILTPSKIFLTVAAAIILLGFVAWPATQWLQNARDQQLIRQFHKENLALRTTLQEYHHRLAGLETNLSQMMKNNPYVKTVAESMTGDQPDYGVGGPASAGPNPMNSTSMVGGDFSALSRLENQVILLKSRITNLDSSMAVRLIEIAHYPSIRPVRTGWMTSYFGDRLDPFTGKLENHPGLDISLPQGSAVYATADGVVKEIHQQYIPNKSYGRYIVIDHGNGYETLYGHLSRIFVKKGQRIKRWDLVAHSGNTGKSTAPHLHYGVYAQGEPKDPTHFILE